MGLASGKVWNSFLDPQGPLVSESLSGGFCFGLQHANFTLHLPSFQDSHCTLQGWLILISSLFQSRCSNSLTLAVDWLSFFVLMK